MCKPSHFELQGAAAALCVSAALLLAAWPARAQDRADRAPTTNLPIALVAPEPVLQLGPPAELGEQESVIREPKFPSETSRRTYPNRPLLATGATIFGLSYIPSIIGAATADGEDNDDKDDLYIPVAGPWMMLAKGPEEERWEKTLLTVSGVAQGLGALMLVSSLFVPQRVTERWYLIGSHTPVRLVPSRLATGYGVRAMGRF